MRWPRDADVAVVVARVKVSVGSVASLLTATTLVTDVGTAADRDVIPHGRPVTYAAHDVIATAVGTTITATGAVIATTNFVAKSSNTPPSSPNSSRLTPSKPIRIMTTRSFADVAELADAQVSEACDGDIVEVQVLSSAPKY